MTPTDKLPLEGTLIEALKVYFSRLRSFGEVALYAGGILALVAYPLMVHSTPAKALYFLCLASAFVIFHGLPNVISRIRQRVSASPKANEEIDAARLVADVAITYGMLQEYVLTGASERLDPIQKEVLRLVDKFPGQVRVEKRYSVAAGRGDDHAGVLVVRERLMRDDRPLTDWLTTVVRVKSGALDSESSLRIVQRISSLGVLLPPDKTTITRST